jgi:hypothetical protein
MREVGCVCVRVFVVRDGVVSGATRGKDKISLCFFLLRKTTSSVSVVVCVCSSDLVCVLVCIILWIMAVGCGCRAIAIVW